MNIVAYTEIAIFVRVLLGAIIFRNSFVTPLIFAQFLKQRYYQSAFTRHAFSVTNAQIEKQIQGAGNPPWALSTYNNGKVLLSKWVGTTLVPNNEGPATAAAATAGGARR